MIPATSDALGIDDWAFKKGTNYGTAIVDLKQRRIIDLLPDREASTVENWFKHNSDVKVVTRDRFARYAKGVTNGLPGATQVADRWHLLKNMGDALQKLLERNRQEIRRNSVPPEPLIAVNNPDDVLKSATSVSQGRRQKQLEEIKRLHNKGVSIRQIAEALKMSRVTVRKYLHLDEPPVKNGGRTNIAFFYDYLHQRMEQDKNVQVIQLWKEIKARGYSGARSTLYECLKGYIKPHNRIKMPKLTDVSWHPSKVSLLLYKSEQKLSGKEIELINDLRKKSPDINAACLLAQKFREMLEQRHGYLLNQWIDEVQQSPIRELKGFAKGLMTDYQAVKNALTLPWSNGQVEGQINKLKTIKCQMYGRASFDLLRKRLILQNSCST